MVKEHIYYSAKEWKEKKKRDLKSGFYMIIGILIFIIVWFLYVNNLSEQQQEDKIKYIEENTLYPNVICGANGVDIKLKLYNPDKQVKTNEYFIYEYNNKNLKIYFQNTGSSNAGKVLFVEVNGEKSKTCVY